MARQRRSIKGSGATAEPFIIPERAKKWRMLEMCDDCPFRTDGGAISLRPGRMDEIRYQVAPHHRAVQPQDFMCHKTTGGGEEEYDEETGEEIYIHGGGERLCAGAIAYQDSKGVCTQYRQIAERLDWFAEERERAEGVDA